MAMPDSDAAAAPLSIEIRPGVNFPDWSAVGSDRVRSALHDIFQVFGVDKFWRDFSPTEDLCRRAILAGYRQRGQAPTLSQLCTETAMSAPEARETLIGLRHRDLVLFDEATQTIQGAYPLTEQKTEHWVQLNGNIVHAMCAIDALGVGRMYECDVTIQSRCRATGQAVRIVTADCGRRLASVEPADVVVWSGIRATQGCAANTLCPLIAFFANDAVLEQWRLEEHPDAPGYRLSVAEAMEAGMAIFGPMLAKAGAPTPP
jgi:mercuric reductase